MATAEPTTVEVKVVTTTTTPGVTLTLTYSEATTLRAILEQVGGSRDHSRRKHADDIHRALSEAGISPNGLISDQMTGWLRFKDYTLPVNERP